MWSGFAEFLDSGQAFGGGRYGMARELMQKELPCLASLCLGQVCHVVQLAIQKRKILVYHRKMLKSTGLAMPSEQSATVNGDGADDDKMEDIKDVYHLCKILFRMLARYPSGLRLDRMKKIMKEEFSCRLNEMTFQC